MHLLNELGDRGLLGNSSFDDIVDYFVVAASDTHEDGIHLSEEDLLSSSPQTHPDFPELVVFHADFFNLLDFFFVLLIICFVDC